MKPLLAVKVYGVWTLEGRERVCVCGNGSETRTFADNCGRVS